MSRSYSRRARDKRYWNDFWKELSGPIEFGRIDWSECSTELQRKYRLKSNINREMNTRPPGAPGWFVNMFAERPTRRSVKSSLRKVIKGEYVDVVEFPRSRRPQVWYW